MSDLARMVAWLLVLGIASSCTPGFSEIPEVAIDEGAVDLDVDPESLELADVPGRYRVALNPISEGNRIHFLLDTATGSVWTGFIPKVDGDVAQLLQVVTEWVAVPVQPPPDAAFPEANRFTIEASYSYGADRFLLDSTAGRMWVLVRDERAGTISFVEQSVERPPTPQTGGSPPPNGAPLTGAATPDGQRTSD